MYTEFYNLKEKPFELTSSPRFLYLGEVHKEALAFLTYGVVERKGFVLLTGDVGTGKTTVLKALLSNLNDDFRYVHPANPPRSADEFMECLSLAVFKSTVHFKSKPAFLVALEERLKQYRRERKNFMLIFDEAQRLTFEVLEEIRLLSNIEMDDEKLVNILLVGQPELNEKLSDFRCRALLQRIGIRYHVAPLGLQDTRKYMAARLKAAGCENGCRIFPDRTVKAIYKHSRGYPRIINIISDNALLLGYTREKKTIPPNMIKQVHQASDSRRVPGEKSGRRKEKADAANASKLPKAFWKWAAALFAILAFVLLVTKTGWEFYTGKADSAHVVRQAVYGARMNAATSNPNTNQTAQKIGIPTFRGIIENPEIRD